MKKQLDVILIDFDGNEKQFVMQLGTREILHFDELIAEITGNEKANLFNSMDKINQGDLKTVLAICLATLKPVNKQGVIDNRGITFSYFDDNFDLFTNLPKMQSNLEVLFKDLQVKPDKNDVGK